ncbi:MAG: LapA family protein [Chitinispirillaceae bacterium]|nr:LapA family protein [Chitinispirillaceae bacterium]
MKIFKWIISFSIAFLVAWILIFTFIQEPFKVPVKARLLAYWTPAIPIYAYVAGAFGIGLLLGLFAAFYYYIVLQHKVHQRTRELHELEAKLAAAQRSLEHSEQVQQQLTVQKEPVYGSAILESDTDDDDDDDIPEEINEVEEPEERS